MRDTMGIIITNDDRIPPITDLRAAGALPIAGSYRMIDFILSNMANANIINIGVITESNYSSLMDHLKSGSPWDLDRKNYGLNILPPNMASFNYFTGRGDLDRLAGARQFLRKSQQTYVILSSDNLLYNIDFEDVMEKHIENQSDVTIVYKNMTGAPESELSRHTLIELDDQNRITDIEVNPQYPKSSNASLEVYVMEKALLESIIDECIARGEHCFVRDGLSKKLSGMNINGYEFCGYCDKIDSLKSYFRNNMLFLNEDLRKELLNQDNPIYTKNKDLSPTIYKENSNVENSLISNGCLIEGTVKNSVLSRGVIVKKGAVIKNSIIMQDSVIEEDASIDCAILDKEVTITKGKKLVGQKSYPAAIAKGSIV